MHTPLRIAFRHVPKDAVLEAQCRDEAAKLERYHPALIGCSVTLAAPHGRHRHGNLFEVRIDMTVPGGEVVVTRQPSQHHENEDPLVAVRQAFDTARRRLEDHARRQRHDVKVHRVPGHGKVRELWPDHGFITTPHGDEVYFHRNSVVDGSFARLQAGHEVRFEVAQGEQGPQATSVARVGRHHHLLP